MRFAALLLAAALCGCSSQPSGEETGLPTVPVTLPNGKVIRAEVATRPADQQRGLMFRSSLDPDRGMLFVFPEPGPHPIWMYQTIIPLDILWLDAGRRVLHLAADTPPCPPENGRNCPSYGGAHTAHFVLELGAGVAAAQGLKVGDTLQF